MSAWAHPGSFGFLGKLVRPLPVGIFDPYFESTLGSDAGLFGDLANFILIGSPAA